MNENNYTQIHLNSYYIYLFIFVNFFRYAAHSRPETLSSTQSANTTIMEDSELRVDDFVVVRVAGKNKTVHYVGKLSEIPQRDLLGSVVYLKREKQTGFTFILNNDDEYEIAKTDIVLKLPEPIRTEGSARISSRMVFPEDLSCFSNLL